MLFDKAINNWPDANWDVGLPLFHRALETPGCTPLPIDIFRALDLTALKDVKVVIIGQDPYPTEGYADGLAFSAANCTSTLPASLRNIFKEVDSELNFGVHFKHSSDLSRWAEQGILLLNTHLTTEVGKSLAHLDWGWEKFTDSIIYNINNINNIIYILWGKHAQEKRKIMTNSKTYLLEGAHPSPLSARKGFFHGNYFTTTNEILVGLGKEPIDWN